MGRGAAAVGAQSCRVCEELPGLSQELTDLTPLIVCSFPVATQEKEEEDPFNYGEWGWGWGCQSRPLP